MSALAAAGPGRRPAAIPLMLDQVVYAGRELWRTRIVLVFTFGLPLVWLVIIGLLAGNEAVDPRSGVRVMQFATPTAAVMGALFATLPPIANSLALAREQHVLKRLRGTPLPIPAYLLGRVGASLVLALAAVAVMLLIGVVAYDVQLIWRTLPAMVVTLVVGIASLAAIGLAIGAVAPSASTAQTVAMASSVVVTFVSGLFTIGTEPPAWLDAAGSAFPIQHLLGSLEAQLDPFSTGSGWDLGALAFVAAWGVGGLVVATWGLRRERTTAARAAPVAASARGAGSVRATAPGRPGAVRLIFDQATWANRSVWRDVGTVFFAVAMPVGLYALMSTLYGQSGFRPAGMPFAFFFASGMTAYGIAVTAFINMPEAVTTARDRRVLKRLRGTPLAAWQYLAGRTASVLWIGALTALLVWAVGVAAFGVTVRLGGVPLAIAVTALGTLTLAACGYALAALAPSTRAATAVGLAILLPLSFFSDVFLVGGAPEWMVTVGSLFPLRHFVHALAASLDPASTAVPWVNLSVMAAWLVGAAVVAVIRFRWEPAP